MSRFYFDLIWKGRRIPDEIGLDLSPGLEVRNAAIHAAVEHAVDVSSDEQGLHTVQVRDAGGDVVLEVALEYGRRLEEPAL
jgi:hypothetical protein